MGAEHCIGDEEGAQLILEELVIDERTVRNEKKKKKKKEKKVLPHIALDYSGSEDEEVEGEKEGEKEGKKVFKHRGKSGIGIGVGAGMDGEKEDVTFTHLCRECLVEFPTRNALFVHLNESGHAVASSEENPKRVQLNK